MRRLCIEPWCLASTTGTRCRAHQIIRTRARGSRAQRGYGSEHQRARAVVLAGNPVCHWCRCCMATEADHVSLDPIAYVPACKSCNSGRRNDPNYQGHR